MSLSLMSGITKLMNEIGGWQELARVSGTPLLHTGHGNADRQRELVELLSRHFPQWQPDPE
jgi:hypothetical protein